MYFSQINFSLLVHVKSSMWIQKFAINTNMDMENMMNSLNYEQSVSAFCGNNTIMKNMPFNLWHVFKIVVGKNVKFIVKVKN